MSPKNKQKGKGARVRATPKGRRVDPAARKQVRELLGSAPRRRDLLIEHLHLIQDRFGCLSALHLVALAAEMKLAMTEVYEVATFYHHFDVVKDGEAAPPAITVRVCDSISCDIAGSRDLLARLPAMLGADVRVLHAPCVGRCDTAPVAVVGQNPVPHATPEKVSALVTAKSVRHATRGDGSSHPHLDIVSPGHIAYDAYRASGGYELAAACIGGAKKREDVIAAMEDSGLRGLGGAGFPAGRKWKIVAAEPAPRLMAINIDEGRAGHVQGSLLPRARPASISRRRARGGLGRRHRGDLHLSSGRVSRLPRHSRSRNRRTPGESAVSHSSDSSAPRRRRLHLR